MHICRVQQSTCGCVHSLGVQVGEGTARALQKNADLHGLPAQDGLSACMQWPQQTRQNAAGRALTVTCGQQLSDHSRHPNPPAQEAVKAAGGG
jgi:hypothetical protein